jgi:hypothetical protein
MNPTALRIAVPAGLAIWSAVAGATLSSRWLWVAGVATTAAALEVYLALWRQDRDDELAAVVGGPLPDDIEIDWEQFDQFLQAWSEEGPR